VTIASIVKVELEYNGDRAIASTAVHVDKGKSGLIHVFGHNDTDEAQKLGIHWLVFDPDNIVREDYSTWEAWPYTGGGVTHEFIGGRFTFDKVGYWVIICGLFAWPEEQVAADAIGGTICLVGAPSRTLRVEVTPKGAGYLETTPNPLSGYKKWVDNSTGQFPDGAQVLAKATPYSGYRFDHWSTDIVGGVSFQNPEYVQDMTRDMKITCHFRGEDQPDTKQFEIDIVGGSGHVITYPASQEGQTIWYAGNTGTFPRGISVKVTAVPDPNYLFLKWSDNILGGTSTENPAYSEPLDSNKAVKCHFREEDEPDTETLEVDITPQGRGTVETDPASQEGKTIWGHDETGKFIRGTNVKVTAHPEPGWAFEKWSDKIVGGTSYDNPAYVQTMDQRRTVKCHFIEGINGGNGGGGVGEITSILVHWGSSTNLSPPASVEDSGSYEIHPVCLNKSGSAIQLRVVARVTKPSGALTTREDIDGWPHTGAGKEFKPTLNMGDIDEVGTWTAEIGLYDHDTEELLDSWSGDLLVVSEASGGGMMDMSAMMGMMMVVMMMGIMMPMMEGMEEGGEIE